jgi:hypothetical protein
VSRSPYYDYARDPDLAAAYHAGYAAYDAYVSSADNPHPAGSDESAAWAAGHDDCAAEDNGPETSLNFPIAGVIR